MKQLGAWGVGCLMIGLIGCQTTTTQLAPVVEDAQAHSLQHPFAAMQQQKKVLLWHWY